MLATGSEYAFSQLFSRYHGKIYGVGMKFLKNTTLAEEVVQEVFMTVWDNRADMKTVLRFEPYLYTMARNHIFRGIKSIARDAVAEKEFSLDLKPVNDTDHGIREEQYEKLLHDAVEKLSPQQKVIFRMAKQEGLSHKAIAEQLNLSVLTVKDQMKKALQTIRRNLEGHVGTVTFIGVIIKVFD